MLVNKDKLIAIIEELYDDLDGCCAETSVCIYEGETYSGTPLQLLLTMTTEGDTMVTSNEGHYTCVGRYREDIE